MGKADMVRRVGGRRILYGQGQDDLDGHGGHGEGRGGENVGGGEVGPENSCPGESGPEGGGADRP